MNTAGPFGDTVHDLLRKSSASQVVSRHKKIRQQSSENMNLFVETVLFFVQLFYFIVKGIIVACLPASLRKKKDVTGETVLITGAGQWTVLVSFTSRDTRFEYCCNGLDMFIFGFSIDSSLFSRVDLAALIGVVIVPVDHNSFQWPGKGERSNLLFVFISLKTHRRVSPLFGMLPWTQRWSGSGGHNFGSS